MPSQGPLDNRRARAHCEGMSIDPKAMAELHASLAAQECPAFERLAALAEATLDRATLPTAALRGVPYLVYRPWWTEPKTLSLKGEE